MNAPHTPVMLDEVAEALKPAAGEVYVDGTFGAGGYTRAILKAAHCKVYGIDQDPDTKRFAEAVAQEFPGRFAYLVGNFSDMCELLAREGVERVDGIVLDLGVSSMRLDQPERGFSFRHDGPLDMRMSQRSSPDAGFTMNGSVRGLQITQKSTSAADFINTANEAEIADVLYHYGEEHAARRIAKAIVQARAEKPFTRTAELAALVAGVVGKTGPKDPATRTFQALRIHINDELGALTAALEAAETLLKPGGRLVVVTFHSLEDRLVKRFTHSQSGKLAGASRHLPLVGSRQRLPAFFLPRGAKVKVSDVEAARNPRARSATLRLAIRSGEGA